MPKGLQLLSRKTRRCIECNKLLTKSFKTFRHEHKVELGHSEPKVLQCQKCPPTEKILLFPITSMRLIRNSTEHKLKDRELFEIKTADLPLEFQVVADLDIPNKEKKQIKYNMVLRYK